MNKSEDVLNVLLVELFNDILRIEQNALKKGPFSDLSITEVHTIEAIGMYGEKTMSEVSTVLKITMGTLTTAINKLIKKGYVERQRIEEDRRVVLIKLTKKGKLVYRVHEKFHKDMIRSVTNKIGEEEEKVLIKALEDLTSHFKEMYKL